MIDIQSLKVLAEQAVPGPWFIKSTVMTRGTKIHAMLPSRTPLIALSKTDKRNPRYESLQRANAEFIAAANPAAVLELIADLERNQRMLLAACLDMGAIGEALGADMNSDGDELLGMISELKEKYQAARNRKNSITALKAENESLQSACAGALKFVAFAFDQGIEGAELAGRTIEAALSKATQPLNPA